MIAAIFLSRNLQQVANFLIVSLAVADLMVACLVMPMGAVYEVGSDVNYLFLQYTVYTVYKDFTIVWLRANIYIYNVVLH